MAKENEIRQEDVARLNEIEFRAEKIFSKPTKVVVLGRKFKVKPLSRWLQNKVLDDCKITLDTDNEQPVVEDNSRDNDIKACAMILLHNPLKVLLFTKIKVWFMKRKYSNEVFYAILKTTFNNPDQVFFYKNVYLIIQAQQARMMKI